MTTYKWDWTGDLDDDCTAVGNGLMLRAEEMDRRVWWWAVLDNNGSRGCDEIIASHDVPPYYARNGKEARHAAMAAAIGYLRAQPTGDGDL